MAARERAVIYVDSSSPTLSSLGSLSSASNCGHHSLSGGKLGSPGGSPYVIKIQIGDEGIFNRPVRIDVAGAHHRQRRLMHLSSDGDGDSLSLVDSSGQSSPRSDMTPPPHSARHLIVGSKGNGGVRQHGGNSLCRFGSETSESDTESDISSEYSHNSEGTTLIISSSRQMIPTSALTSLVHPSQFKNTVPISAAQFARREILGVETDPGLDVPCATPAIDEDEEQHGFCLDDLSCVLKDNLNASLMKAFSSPLAPQNSKSPPPFPPPSRPDSESESVDLRSFTPPRHSLMSDSSLLMRSRSSLYKIPECVQLPQSNTCQIHIEQESFHIEEFKEDASCPGPDSTDSMTNFAGYKDIFSRTNSQGPRQIMSEKGTIRGVKNRVRDGIATFLQSTDSKNYNEKEQGRVVVYVTSMGVVRDTYQRCQKVKQILRNLLVKFDERDCYMNQAVQEEIRERFPLEMRRKEFQRQKAQNNGSTSRGVPKGAGRNGPGSFYDIVTLPQVFIEGQYLGDAETIEKLNETGELRKMLQPYKNASVLTTCNNCGGYRMLPCPICNGSKKSVHRNHFTEEFVALKCMHCDPAGLVKCPTCNA